MHLGSLVGPSNRIHVEHANHHPGYCDIEISHDMFSQNECSHCIHLPRGGGKRLHIGVRPQVILGDGEPPIEGQPLSFVLDDDDGRAEQKPSIGDHVRGWKDCSTDKDPLATQRTNNHGMLEQYYYTHCTAQSSIFDKAGFGILRGIRFREGDTTPLGAGDSWAGGLRPSIVHTGFASSWYSIRSPDPVGSPSLDGWKIRRGAFGLHSTDTKGRERSFFSHIIAPQPGDEPLSAQETVGLWGAQGTWGATDGFVWSDESFASGGGHLLDPWQTQLTPTTSLLSVESLQGFLAGRGDAIRAATILLANHPRPSLVA